MDLRNLKYFVTIVEEKTLKKASKRLNIAQPALSIELKKLEDELNVLLFERKNRSLVITKEGRLLYQKSLAILQMASNIKEDLKERQNIIIRLGVMSSAFGIYISDCLNTFIKNNPNISFDITENSTYELLEKLTNDEIELAFVRTPFNNSSLEVIPFQEESMVAIGKREFFNDTLDTITLKELSQKPLIYYKRYEALLQETFAHKSLNFKYLCKCEDAKTAVLWANQGLGVSILPKSAIGLIDNLVVKRIDSAQLKTTPMIVYKSYEGLSPQAKLLVDAYKKITNIL